MMLYSTYNLLVSGVLFLLISFIAIIEPASWVIVASSISCCGVTFSLCILFVPKVYLHYKKVKVVASELFNSATIKSHSIEILYKQRSKDKDVTKRGSTVISKDITANNIRLISVESIVNDTKNKPLPSFDSGRPNTLRNFMS